MTLATKPTSNKAGNVDYDPFRTGPLQASVPTTESQKEILATLALDPDSTLCYNESICVELKGSINRDQLNLSFQEVLKRHDSLRSFFSQDGKFVFIREFQAQNLEFYDWSLKADALKDIESFKHSLIINKFDLTCGPCFKGHLVKLSSDHYLLFLTGHHAVMDGWSFAVILTELSTLYTSFSKHLSSPYNSAAQFFDYARLEAQNGSNSANLKYWVDLFKSPPKTKALPLDFARPDFRTYNSERLDVVFPEDLVIKLKKLGATQGCSLYTVLMASFQVLLGQLTKGEELVIGMASAAQSELGKNDLVGHMVNLLPLRSEIHPNQKFNFFLKETRTKMLDAFDHQLFSYGTLLKNLNLERNPAEIPLLNIVFNIDQQAPGQGLNFHDLKASYTTIPRKFENFEMFVNAVSCENKLVFECQYNSNLFKSSTIENWFKNYIELLSKIVQQPENPINHYQLSNLYIPEKLTAVLSSHVTPLKADAIIEQKLLCIWQDVLNLKQISNKQNFFSLGGHSLLAAEVASLIKKEFACEISIREVFENPTLEQLTSVVMSASLKNSVADATAIIPKTQNQDTFPVTHNQMQVWYLEEMYPGTLMHNLPSSIRLRFAVDKVILEKTLTYLVQRHASLRTAIMVEDGVPVQKVLDRDLSQFNIKIDLKHSNEQDISALLNKEADFVIDKESPPLFKIRLYQLGYEDFVFFFMAHHAIWDGWSFDIFFEELNIIYSAFAKNEAPQFSSSPAVEYGDYSTWLNDSITNGRFSKEISFWKQNLASPLPVLELPLDFKRPLTISHIGNTFSFQFKDQESDSLRKYAKSQGTSLFNVLLTVFKITLSRYSNQEDVIVGSPVRARNKQELLSTIGYFVNTVALRTHLKIDQSFEENLRLVTKVCLDAFDNQTIPFQVILNSVNYPKDSSRTPVFQTFFSFQDVNNRDAQINGHPYTQINIDKASTHTDFDLWIKASDNKIEGAFEYRADLFKHISVERFYESFMLLLNQLSFHVDQPILNRPVITQNQAEVVLKKWNDTCVACEASLPVHKMFEVSVSKYPNSIAIETEKESITYQELNILANKAAISLMKSGVGLGDIVGISLSREIKMVAAILAVLKTGAAYVPLDPAFPQARLDYMVEASVPKKILTEPSLEKRFSQFEQVCLIDDLLNSKSIDQNFVSSSELNGTVYVIYTSGSTGKPKGVEIGHAALSNFLNSMAKKPGIKSTDKLLAVTTLSFDIAALEIFLPLISGASLYLASNYDVLDGKALKNIIESRGINFMQATPSTWRLLISAGWTGSPELKVLCGGEAFPVDLAQRLASICNSVWNMYGPTETTVWSTCKKIESDIEHVTIGKPIDNTSVYVLDKGLNLAPIGSSGELYIGGRGLANGYFHRADLTAERFINNPFEPGHKIYATGDLARFTWDGELECLGRNDGQVKVRGYRIELGEIEAVLAKLPEVTECSVVTKEVKSGDTRILAYLVIKNSETINEASFRERLAEKLPKYMIPSHFIQLSELPKTLNGKIDKKTLQVKPFEQHELKVVPAVVVQQESVTGFEQELRSIWMDVLNLSNIRNQDNFFEVGGNSLLAVQLFSKIARKYKVNLPLSLLLDSADFSSFVISVKAKVHSPQLSSEVTRSVPSALVSLVSIKASGDKNPVFCFHSVGGNVLNYMGLTSALSKSRPCIGVQSRGLDGVIPLSTSIEEMARHYINEMKTIQPEGPYFLAGGSMGGTIAFEVAQQLTKQGDKIEKLVMFDTFGPDNTCKVPSESHFLKNHYYSLMYRLKTLVNQMTIQGLKLIGLNVPLATRLFAVEVNNYRALWKYQAQEYRGDIHIIRAEVQPSGWYSDPKMGWSKKIKGNIFTYEIPATHHDFMENPKLPKVFAKLV